MGAWDRLYSVALLEQVLCLSRPRFAFARMRQEAACRARTQQLLDDYERWYADQVQQLKDAKAKVADQQKKLAESEQSASPESGDE